MKEITKKTAKRGRRCALPGKPGVHLSLRDIAEIIGADRSFVRRRLSDADIQGSGTRYGHLVYDAKDAWSAFTNEDRTPESIDAMSAVDRLAWFRGTKLKRENEKRALQLIPAEEVAEEKARILRLIKQGLSLVLKIVASDESATPAMVERMREHVQSIERQIDDATTLTQRHPGT